jgi:hypothetical protein
MFYDQPSIFRMNIKKLRDKPSGRSNGYQRFNIGKWSPFRQFDRLIARCQISESRLMGAVGVQPTYHARARVSGANARDRGYLALVSSGFFAGASGFQRGKASFVHTASPPSSSAW